MVVDGGYNSNIFWKFCRDFSGEMIQFDGCLFFSDGLGNQPPTID